MNYSKDLRERVLAYIVEGHTKKETSEVFKVGTTTIESWKNLLSETGKLDKKQLSHKPRNFESEKLRAYVSENPETTLAEIASEFGGSPSGAFAALECGK
jgi:transposase